MSSGRSSCPAAGRFAAVLDEILEGVALGGIAAHAVADPARLGAEDELLVALEEALASARNSFPFRGSASGGALRVAWNESPPAFEAALDALAAAGVPVYADRGAWTSLQKQGMKSEVSWGRSAQKYARLYQSLLAKRVA